MSPTTRVEVTTTICRRPARSINIGETYACTSLKTFQTGAPVVLLYATTDLPEVPPGRTITLSSTISGDAAMAHGRFEAWLSDRMFLPHMTAPLLASRQRSSPVAPSA